MDADFTIKRFDRLPSFKAALTELNEEGNEVPINLTGATVRFIMKNKETGVVKVNAPAVIVGTATLGIVRYDWAVGDTNTLGSYQAEWAITHLNGLPQTAPTLTYHTIDVVADLDAA